MMKSKKEVRKIKKNKFWSPLRYPGGKSKLTNLIDEIIHSNSLEDSTYIEPFAGGAGVAISLLMNEKCKRIIINDYDVRIYHVWKSMLEQTDRFIERINKCELSIDEWKIHHDLVCNYDESYTGDYFDLGFSTFYLNRTNRSGIIKGGPIGGMDQQSEYDLGCRFNKEKLISRIRAISSKRSQISLYNYDAVDFLKKVVSRQKKKSLIFFDPPYYDKGKKLYMNFFTDKDHVNLLAQITKVNQKHCWIVTYDVSPEIISIYHKYEPYLYKLNYSAANKGKSFELLYKSENMALPKHFVEKTISLTEYYEQRMS